MGGVQGTLPGKALGETLSQEAPPPPAIHQGEWKARNTKDHVVTVELAGAGGESQLWGPD